MIELWTFVPAVIALLAVPGPTNTLLAASGGAIGLRPSLPLIPAEVAGYLIAIACLMSVVQPLAETFHLLPVISKLVASVYLAWTAAHLWRDGSAETVDVRTPASPGRVFLTTLLNPKALVFAFVIFPRVDLAPLVIIAVVFSALVAVIGSLWILFGSLLARSAVSAATPQRISRIAAAALGIFATLLASSAVAEALR